MPQVDSSFIKSLEYDPSEEEVVCEFKDGKTFGYSPISQEQYEQWLNAESVGKYFHAHIRKNSRYSVRPM